jgi:hypothetical protein
MGTEDTPGFTVGGVGVQARIDSDDLHCGDIGLDVDRLDIGRGDHPALLSRDSREDRRDALGDQHAQLGELGKPDSRRGGVGIGLIPKDRACEVDLATRSQLPAVVLCSSYRLSEAIRTTFIQASIPPTAARTC